MSLGGARVDPELARNLIQRINVADWADQGRGRAASLDRRGRRPAPLELRRVERLGQPAGPAGWPPGATRAATRSRWPRATASSSWPPTTHAPSSAWSACRSTWAGARTRWPTCSGHSRSRGIVIEAQLVPGCADAVGEGAGVADVFVAPGTRAGLRGRAGRARLVDLRRAGRDDDAEPECFVDDRDPLSYLYTSGTTSFPKGVVGNHTAIYLESMSVRAGRAVEQRPTGSRR